MYGLLMDAFTSTLAKAIQAPIERVKFILQVGTLAAIHPCCPALGLGSGLGFGKPSILKGPIPPSLT
jgi:hypothetical protein